MDLEFGPLALDVQNLYFGGAQPNFEGGTMEQLRNLNVIRVNKKELIDKISVNRDGHRAVFEEALEGFHAAVIEKLNAALKDAKAGKRYKTYFDLPEPQDHTNDYDRVILMLEMSQDDEILLDERQFAQYVQDDWGWKPDFLATAGTYTRSL